MPLTTYSISELLHLKPPSWLVDGVIPEQALVALYGAPGDGKSFIALDLALSIAAGVPWQGHVTQKGYVVYISAEGGGGISKRVGAWLDHHGITRDVYPDLFTTFVVSTIRIHPDSEDLIDIINQTVHNMDYLEILAYGGIGPEDDTPPLFIIVDTLARCFEGDENKQEDMGRFIKGLDGLRDQHGATVLVVHHTGRAGLEERGSSAFRGACDTMMSVVKRGDDITLACTKQKDTEEFKDKTFELLVVEKWDSCIVKPTIAGGGKDKKTAAVLDMLRTAGSLSHGEWWDLAKELVSKSTFDRMLRTMRDTRIISKNNGIYEELVSGEKG